MQRQFLHSAVFALAVGGLLFGPTPGHPAAHAAPPVSKAAAGTMADLLNGKLYPSALKRAELVPLYHYVTLIDAQGKPAECATKGDMVTLGGETFLVAYLLLDAPKPTTATDAAPPPDAQLTLINMHYVQALGSIRDTPTPPAPQAASGGTPPAAGQTAGTAAP